MTGPCFYTGTNETMYSFLKILICSSSLLSSQFYLNVFGLNKPYHKTPVVVDPGGEWDEGRVGGVVVVGGDGCRPRGVGGGEREGGGWGEGGICS